MISAGDGTPDRPAAVSFRSFMPGCRVGWRGVRHGPRPVERDAGQLVRPVPGVTRARPSAVAIGLRRSGRTGNGNGNGNGKSPMGASRPRASPTPPTSLSDQWWVRASARCDVPSRPPGPQSGAGAAEPP